jgi:hypothetical protein
MYLRYKITTMTPSLEETIKELLPKEKEESRMTRKLGETDYLAGYNQAVTEAQAATPTIIEAVYAHVTEEQLTKMIREWVCEVDVPYAKPLDDIEQGRIIGRNDHISIALRTAPDLAKKILSEIKK